MKYKWGDTEDGNYSNITDNDMLYVYISKYTLITLIIQYIVETNHKIRA